MSIEGVFVNGKVEFDTPPTFPEGTRVNVDLADEFEVDFPFEPYDREKELAILRASIEDMKAGRGTPARQFLKEIAAEYNLPLAPGE